MHRVMVYEWNFNVAECRTLAHSGPATHGRVERAWHCSHSIAPSFLWFHSPHWPRDKLQSEQGDMRPPEEPATSHLLPATVLAKKASKGLYRLRLWLSQARKWEGLLQLGTPKQTFVNQFSIHLGQLSGGSPGS